MAVEELTLKKKTRESAQLVDETQFCWLRRPLYPTGLLIGNGVLASWGAFAGALRFQFKRLNAFVALAQRVDLVFLHDHEGGG